MFARRTWQYVATPKTRNWHQDINPQTSPVKPKIIYMKRRYGTLENTWKTTVTRIRSIHNDHALPLEEKYTLIVQLFTKTDDDVPLIFSILGEMEL